MRPAPAPRTRPGATPSRVAVVSEPGDRVAALQHADEAPTATLLSRGGARPGSTGIGDPRVQREYNTWQDWAKFFARNTGIARFPAAMTASVVRRLRIYVAERQPNGEWAETTDERLRDVPQLYSNALLGQGAGELAGTHAHHYGVAGECLQAMYQGPSKTDWMIFSQRAAEWDKPDRGAVTLKLVPGGKPESGTALVVGRDAVTRFWTPDEEWLGLASSPMTSVVDDLRRLWELNQRDRRLANNRFATNGVWWTPGEAHDLARQQSPNQADRDSPVSPIDRQFIEWVRRTWDENEDPAAAAPFGQHWPKDLGKPEWVKAGPDLTDASLALKDEARRDVARGLDMPGSMVEAGGPGDTSHWTEWKVDEEFLESIRPLADRLFHQDLTQTFLVIPVRFYGLDESRYRLDYDEADVVVHPDKSELSIRLTLAGLLKGKRTLEECGFDPVADMMDEDERRWVIELQSKGGMGSTLGHEGGGLNGDAPIDAATTTEGPPVQVAPAVPRAAAVDGVESSVVSGEEMRAERDANRARRVIGRLNQARRDVARELKAAAEQALEEALAAARGKVASRTRGRKQGTAEVRAACLEACERGGPLGPFLAAVGITEEEAIGPKLETFDRRARARIAAQLATERRELRAAGLDPDVVPSDDHADRAAAYLTAGVTALAYRELTAGPQAPPEVGEIAGRVPARMVAQALDVAHGTGTATLPEARGEAPGFDRDPNAARLEDQVFAELSGIEDPNRALEWTWVHGFYGDPERPFEPHEDLGASDFTTTMPGGDLSGDVDPDLAAIDSPFGDYPYPGDHDGCTCEWVPAS